MSLAEINFLWSFNDLHPAIFNCRCLIAAASGLHSRYPEEMDALPDDAPNELGVPTTGA